MEFAIGFILGAVGMFIVAIFSTTKWKKGLRKKERRIAGHGDKPGSPRPKPKPRPRKKC